MLSFRDLELLKEARNTGNALRNLTQFIGCFASTLSETEKQFEIINMGKDVLLKSMRLINEAQKALSVQVQTNKDQYNPIKS